MDLNCELTALWNLLSPSCQDCCLLPKHKKDPYAFGYFWHLVAKSALELLLTSGFVLHSGKLAAAVLGIEHRFSLHLQIH